MHKTETTAIIKTSGATVTGASIRIARERPNKATIQVVTLTIKLGHTGKQKGENNVQVERDKVGSG